MSGFENNRHDPDLMAHSISSAQRQGGGVFPDRALYVELLSGYETSRSELSCPSMEVSDFEGYQHRKRVKWVLRKPKEGHGHTLRKGRRN